MINQKKRYEHRMPLPGETVHIHSGENFIYPHGLAFYLGADKTGLHKILLPSWVRGWVIVDMEGLENCRPIGVCNLRHKKHDEEGNPLEFDYIVYDGKEKTTMELRLLEGVWMITNEFDMPSWVDKSKKKDRWIMPDPSAYVESEDSEIMQEIE